MKKLLTLTGICSALLMALAVTGQAGPGSDGGAGKGEGKGRPGGPGGGQRPDPAQMFKHLDTDGNGSLSLEEYKNGPMAKRAKDPAMVDQRFKGMDVDGDGAVTEAEFKAAIEKAGGAPGRPRPGDGEGTGPGKGKGPAKESGSAS